jgi:uncharacterized membrane protein
MLNRIAMFSIFKRKRLSYFSAAEQEIIKRHIQVAEKTTSGEIRLFVEPRCSFVNPLDRAKEIFKRLKMEHTLDRNGVLLYLAFSDRQFAIYGDIHIYKTLGKDGFIKEATLLQQHLIKNNVVQGICETITSMGNTLQLHFPYSNNDKNELPDDIVFGK